MIGNPVEENPIDLPFNHFYERFDVPIHSSRSTLRARRVLARRQGPGLVGK